MGRLCCIVVYNGYALLRLLTLFSDCLRFPSWVECNVYFVLVRVLTLFPICCGFLGGWLVGWGAVGGEQSLEKAKTAMERDLAARAQEDRLASELKEKWRQKMQVGGGEGGAAVHNT